MNIAPAQSPSTRNTGIPVASRPKKSARKPVMSQASIEAKQFMSDVFTDELMVFEGMADSRFPELPACYRFMCRDQPVERALRQGQRHVWQGRGIRDRAHELHAPRLTGAAVVPNFQALEVAVGIQRLVRAVP